MTDSILQPRWLPILHTSVITAGQRILRSSIKPSRAVLGSSSGTRLMSAFDDLVAKPNAGETHHREHGTAKH